MTETRSPLALARFASGYTQIELAEKLGVTGATISKWESEPGVMKLDSFMGFYNAMGTRGQSILDQYLDDLRLFSSPTTVN